MRGSFSSDGTPANISCSSARTTAPRYVAGERQRGEVVGRRPVDDRVADRPHLLAMAPPRSSPRTRELPFGNLSFCSVGPHSGGPPCPAPSSSRPPAPRSASSPARFVVADRHRPRRPRDPGRARARRREPRAGRLRVHRPGHPGRLRPDARTSGGGQGRHPPDVPSIGLNKACLSGIDAIYLADLMIQAGDADVVVAGGMESMTQAPYLLQNARAGYRMGNGALRRLDARRRPRLRPRRHPHGRGHRALHAGARRDHA